MIINLYLIRVYLYLYQHLAIIYNYLPVNTYDQPPTRQDSWRPSLQAIVFSSSSFGVPPLVQLKRDSTLFWFFCPQELIRSSYIDFQLKLVKLVKLQNMNFQHILTSKHVTYQSHNM